MTKQNIIDNFESLGYSQTEENKYVFENVKRDKYIKIDVDSLEVKCMHRDRIAAARMNMKEIRLIYELLKCLRDDD